VIFTEEKKRKRRKLSLENSSIRLISRRNEKTSCENILNRYMLFGRKLIFLKKTPCVKK